MIYNTLERRASLENPSTGLLQAFGAEPLPSGQSVNESTALRLSVAFACIRTIAETLSTVSFKVYEVLRGEGAGRREARGHYLWPVVHMMGNRESTAQSMLEVMAAHLAGWGNGYLEPELSRTGEVLGLWPLLPDRTTPEREGQTKILKSQVNGQEKTYRPVNLDRPSRQQYLHIPFMGYDGLKGYSVLGMARRAVGLGLALQEEGERFFGHGVQFPYVMEHPEFLGPERRGKIRESIEEAHAGPVGRNRVLVADDGMKVKSIGMPMEDAQFIESSYFNVEQVARFFRMQPHKIQHLKNATFSNIEMQAIEHVTDTLRPYAVRIEQAFNYWLFPQDQRGRFFVEFELDSLMRGDSTARGDFYTKLWQVGAITQNEIRRRENMNPLDEPSADQTFVPLNFVPSSQAGEPPEPEPSPFGDEGQASRARAGGALARQRLQRAHRQLFLAAASRYVTREIRALERLLSKATKGDWASIWIEGLEQLRETLEPVIMRELMPVLTVFGEALRAALETETAASREVLARGGDEMTEAYAEKAAQRHTGQTRAVLRPLIEAEDADGIAAQLRDWTDTRPERIAARESVKAGGALTRAALTAAGFMSFVWLAVGENCPLCDRLDGRTVGQQQVFVAKGDTVGNEGTSSLTVRQSIFHPPLHEGCDCVIGVA